MSEAADEVDAMTKPEMARPAMTPPPAVVAHAANANMHTCARLGAVSATVQASIRRSGACTCSKGGVRSA